MHDGEFDYGILFGWNTMYSGFNHIQQAKQHASSRGAKWGLLLWQELRLSRNLTSSSNEIRNNYILLLNKIMMGLLDS